VTEVVAVERERHLRAMAIQDARVAPVPVRVVDGLGEQFRSRTESSMRPSRRSVPPASRRHCERFSFRIPPLDPPKRHILGVARKIARDDQAPRIRRLT
jgi:hypothetical protein